MSPRPSPSAIEGVLSVSTGTRFISFPVGTLLIGAPELDIDARITGSALISVTGNSGDLFLNHSNDFTGAFTVTSAANPGILVHLNNDFSLGATTAGSTNSGRAGFFLEIPTFSIGESFTICGNGPFN